MTLASLEDAKLQLHVTDPAREPEITLLLEQASAIVFDYIGSRADPLWDEDTAPDIVQASTLYTLGHLWEHRGDDAAEQTDERFWQGLSLRLMRLRDPAIA
jgi:hypothetical protein